MDQNAVFALVVAGWLILVVWLFLLIWAVDRLAKRVDQCLGLADATYQLVRTLVAQVDDLADDLTEEVAVSAFSPECRPLTDGELEALSRVYHLRPAKPRLDN